MEKVEKHYKTLTDRIREINRMKMMMGYEPLDINGVVDEIRYQLNRDDENHYVYNWLFEQMIKHEDFAESICQYKLVEGMEKEDCG